MKTHFKGSVFALMILTAALTAASGGILGQKPVADDVFKTGKIRFVPLVTITDEAMGGKGFFSELADVSVDDKGRVYVSDGKENNVKVFDAKGAYLKTIGRSGQGPGEFNLPAEIEVVRDRLFVREIFNRRVSIFDSAGIFVKSIPIDMAGGTWWAMRALPDGRFIVQKEILDYRNPNAPHEMHLDLYSKDLEPIKTIYRHGILRDKYITEPVRTNVPIPFAANVHWSILPDGMVVVGYSESYEIEIHDPDKGKLASFKHEYKPAEVTAKDKEAAFQGMVSSFGGPEGRTVTQGAPDYIVKNTEFPKFKPPFLDLKTDGRGRIWVELYGSTISNESPPRDVFDSAGRFLGSIRIVGDYSTYRMANAGDIFWALHTTKDEEWTVVKYGIEAVR
jgi:hypothetical protein